MELQKYTNYISKGLDPFKEEFNKASISINMVLASDMPDNEKVEIFKQIAKEMDEDLSPQLKLGL